MRNLYRSRTNAVVGGVCGGFGDYWGVDPVLLRLIVIFLTVLTAFVPIFLFYLIAWVIIPREPAEFHGRSYYRLYRSRRDRYFAGVCGGLAEFLGMDSAILRLLIVVIGLLTAIVPMLTCYVVGWLVIPNEPY